VLDALSPDSSVAVREVDGAAGPGAVGRQLEEARRKIGEGESRKQTAESSNSPWG
jgi:hypothetical protein